MPVVIHTGKETFGNVSRRNRAAAMKLGWKTSFCQAKKALFELITMNMNYAKNCALAMRLSLSSCCRQNPDVAHGTEDSE
jgi:hypothetical protein